VSAFVKRIFRYRLSPETFGYSLVNFQTMNTLQSVQLYVTHAAFKHSKDASSSKNEHFHGRRHKVQYH